VGSGGKSVRKVRGSQKTTDDQKEGHRDHVSARSRDGGQDNVLEMNGLKEKTAQSKMP